MSNITQEIIDLLLNKPEEWEEDNYTIQHKSGINIWVSNGISFYKIFNPVRYEFPFLDKIRLWYAIDKWKQLKVLTLVNESK